MKRSIKKLVAALLFAVNATAGVHAQAPEPATITTIGGETLEGYVKHINYINTISHLTFYPTEDARPKRLDARSIQEARVGEELLLVQVDFESANSGEGVSGLATVLVDGKYRLLYLKVNEDRTYVENPTASYGSPKYSDPGEISPYRYIITGGPAPVVFARGDVSTASLRAVARNCPDAQLVLNNEFDEENAVGLLTQFVALLNRCETSDPRIYKPKYKGGIRNLNFFLEGTYAIGKLQEGSLSDGLTPRPLLVEDDIAVNNITIRLGYSFDLGYQGRNRLMVGLSYMQWSTQFDTVTQSLPGAQVQTRDEGRANYMGIFLGYQRMFGLENGKIRPFIGGNVAYQFKVASKYVLFGVGTNESDDLVLQERVITSKNDDRDVYTYFRAGGTLQVQAGLQYALSDKLGLQVAAVYGTMGLSASGLTKFKQNYIGLSVSLLRVNYVAGKL